MLQLISWNVNGIRACYNNHGLAQLLQQHQPDILCLQEVKADASQVVLQGLETYQPIWNSAQRKGYSGTLVLSKLKPVNYWLNFNNELTGSYTLSDQFGDSNLEGRLITVEFDQFYLVTVYTPNSKGDLSRLNLRFNAWDPAFKQHCQTLARHKPVLASGDFNVAHQPIDLAHPEANRNTHGFTDEERSGFDALLKAGFVDSFRTLHPEKTDAYSWWSYFQKARSRNIGWRIDYWLASSNIEQQISSAHIHADILGSDHCPVSVTVDL